MSDSTPRLGHRFTHRGQSVEVVTTCSRRGLCVKDKAGRMEWVCATEALLTPELYQELKSRKRGQDESTTPL